MFYTLLFIDCSETSFTSTTVCGVQDAYRVIYALVRGETLLNLQGDNDDEEEMSSEAVALITVFLFLLFVLAVAFLVYILLGVSLLDPDQIASQYFWEPKMLYVFTSGDLQVDSSISTERRDGGFYRFLAHAWDTLTFPWTGGNIKNSQNWYSSSARSSALAWLFGCLAIVVLPMWILLGGVTMGLLWPPQVRRWIFRPSRLYESRRSSKQMSEQSTMTLLDARREIAQLKEMSYEKSSGVERELKGLKELLLSAMKED